MTTTSCCDLNLRDYLICRLITLGPFWPCLILILIWANKLVFFRLHSDDSNGNPSVIEWLEPYLRSYRDAVVWLVLHLGILIMQLIEGYWILTIWWQWFTEYWSWELKRSQWAAQLWQAVAFVLLAVALVGLLLAGILLLLFAVGSIIELWQWKPTVEVEDAILDKRQEPEEDFTVRN